MNIIEDLIKELEEFGIKKTYEANQLFIREGQIPRKIAIVKSGLFRYFYLTDDGKEFTKGFLTERNFISSYSAMIKNSNSYFSIEALEQSVVMEISYIKFQKLRKDSCKWDKLLIHVLEKGYSIKEKRERDLLLLDAETRYLNFLMEYPNLEKRVSLSLIASFLGIQPESLSRIRKNLST